MDRRAMRGAIRRAFSFSRQRVAMSKSRELEMMGLSRLFVVIGLLIMLMSPLMPSAHHASAAPPISDEPPPQPANNVNAIPTKVAVTPTVGALTVPSAL